MGDAFGRVLEEATQFPNRAARSWLDIYGFGTDPRTVFGPARHQRLVEVKRRYDHQNVFRANPNIPPGRQRSSALRSPSMSEPVSTCEGYQAPSVITGERERTTHRVPARPIRCRRSCH